MMQKNLKATLSRITPTVLGDLLIVGTGNNGLTANNFTNGATLMAVNRHNGTLVWATSLDDHPLSTITQSPVVKGNTIYIGVSAVESGTIGYGFGATSPVPVPGTNKSYTCCTFRGSIVALNAINGSIKWRTFTIPTSEAEKDWTNRPTGPTNSWSGNSVWGSTPVIDLKRNSLYIGTGQTQTLPASVAAANGLVYPYSSNPTVPAGSYPTSILALDLDTGAIKWAKPFGKINGFEAWNLGCSSFFGLLYPAYGFDWFASNAYCPSSVDLDRTNPVLGNFYKLNNPYDFFFGSLILNTFYGIPTPLAPIAPNGPFANLTPPYPSGPISFDLDFAQGPMLVENVKLQDDKKQDLLIAAQKSGVTYALNPDNGDVIWATFEGPGGAEGGHEWGSATDGKRVYLANANLFNTPVALKDISGNISTAYGGYWSALDIATGQILWETAAPFGGGAFNPLTAQFGYPSRITGAVSVANGVVYVGARENNGTVYGLDAATGNILFSYATGSATNPSSMNARPVVVNGTLYFGAGYSTSGVDAGSNQFTAMSLPNSE